MWGVDTERWNWERSDHESPLSNALRMSISLNIVSQVPLRHPYPLSLPYLVFWIFLKNRLSFHCVQIGWKVDTLPLGQRDRFGCLPTWIFQGTFRSGGSVPAGRKRGIINTGCLEGVEQSTNHWLPVPEEESNYMEDSKENHYANHQK